jgi:hypothetical protein
MNRKYFIVIGLVLLSGTYLWSLRADSAQLQSLTVYGGDNQLLQIDTLTAATTVTDGKLRWFLTEHHPLLEELRETLAAIADTKEAATIDAQQRWQYGQAENWMKTVELRYSNRRVLWNIGPRSTALNGYLLFSPHTETIIGSGVLSIHNTSFLRRITEAPFVLSGLPLLTLDTETSSAGLVTSIEDLCFNRELPIYETGVSQKQLDPWQQLGLSQYRSHMAQTTFGSEVTEVDAPLSTGLEIRFSALSQIPRTKIGVHEGRVFLDQEKKGEAAGSVRIQLQATPDFIRLLSCQKEIGAEKVLDSVKQAKQIEVVHDMNQRFTLHNSSSSSENWDAEFLVDRYFINQFLDDLGELQARRLRTCPSPSSVGPSVIVKFADGAVGTLTIIESQGINLSPAERLFRRTIRSKQDCYVIAARTLRRIFPSQEQLTRIDGAIDTLVSTGS